MKEKLRVLLLEDNEHDALLVTHELKRAGFQIDWTRVDTPDDFTRELDSRPDLILVDYALPKIDALKALAILKQSGHEIPFIVISGAITEETAVRTIKEGASDYLLKDRLGRLGPAVEHALAENRLRQEKSRTEQALAESEAKYRKLFEESREAIFTTDKAGVITECNPAFEAILGYEREGVLGHQLANFFANTQEENKLSKAREQQGFARNIELRLKHKNGDILHVLFTESELKDEQDQAPSYLGIARDITERKINQREMEVIVAVNAELRTAPDRESLVPKIAVILRELTQATHIAMYLADFVTGEFCLETLVGGWEDMEGFDIRFKNTAVPVFENKNLYQWNDLDELDELDIKADLSGLKTLLCLPLVSGQETIGIVWIGCKSVFPEEVLQLAQVVTNIAATAIHRSTLNENNLRALQETEAIANISRILNQNLQLDTIFENVVGEAVHIIANTYRAVIHIFDEKNKSLHAVALGDVNGNEIDVNSLLQMSVSPNNEFDFSDLADQEVRAARMRAGLGIAGLAIESGKPIIVKDTLSDERYLLTDSESSVRSLVVTPILSGDRRLGTLSVLGKAPNMFNIADQKLLEKLCVQVAIAIENARLLEAERQQHELAQAQAKISALLNQTLSIEEVLSGIIQYTLQFFGAKGANIMLIEDGAIQLVRHIGYEIPPDKRLFRFDSIEGLPENDLMRRAYETGEKTIAPDTGNQPDWNAEYSFAWVRSFASIPLKIGNRVIGLLNIESEIPHAFGKPEIEQLDIFANSAAVALNNARLYQDLEQALQTEKETRLQLIRADKLAGMGRMVASVAHELNNPLQTIKNCLFLIDQTHKESQDTDLLVLAMSEVERLSLIVNQLRDVYRPAENQEFKTTQLRPLLADLEKLLETHLRRNNVTFDLAKGKAKGILVQAIPDQMKQVFLNLSLNAIEAMQPDGGVLKIRVKTGKRKGLVGISFSDTGHGIPEQDLKVVFDPFYTTKTTGMGLGLSICYDIVQNHNGFIEVENNADVGVTFTVWLPVQIRQEPHPRSPKKILSHKKDSG